MGDRLVPSHTYIHTSTHCVHEYSVIQAHIVLTSTAWWKSGDGWWVAIESLGARVECCVLPGKRTPSKPEGIPRCGHTEVTFGRSRCFLAHESFVGRCRRFSVHLISRRAVSRRPNRASRACGATDVASITPPPFLLCSHSHRSSVSHSLPG